MRRWLLVVLLLALARGASASPRPEQPAPEALSDEEAANAVIAAVRAKDAARLEALAAADDPDPWRVADLLGAKGEWDAAAAFAKAAARPATKALSAYVAARQGRDAGAAARAALAASDEASAAGDFAAALAKLEGVGVEGDGVLASDLEEARANLLERLERPEEASRAHAAAAEIAARIGWGTGAGPAWFGAGVDAYRVSDFRGAVGLFEKALPFLEAGTNRALLTGAVQNLAALYGRLGDRPRALAAHERALAIREELGDDEGVAQSCDSLGTLYTEGGDLEKALGAFERALTLREAHGAPERVAAALSSLATVHQARGDFPKAVALYARALALQRAAHDDEGAARTLSNLGVARAHQGDTKEALALEEEALALLGADDAAHRALAAQVRLNIGWIHYSRGDLGRALDVVTKVRALTEGLGDLRLESLVLATLGAVHLRLGDYPKAMGLLVRAEKGIERLGARSTQAEILGQIGEIHRLLGEYPKSMETHERAQRLAEESGDRACLAGTLSNVAAVYLSLGDVRKSLELLERARALLEKLGLPSKLAVCLGSIGVARARLHDHEGAIEEQTKALALLEQLGDRQGVARTLCNLADARVRAARPAEALPLLERSQGLCRESKERAALAGVLDGFGDAYRALADPKKALGYYERAALEADRLGEIDLLVDALTGAAEAHLDLGEAALALGEAKRAASYVDRLTRGQGEEQGAAAQEQYVRLYDAGTRAAAALDDVAQATFFLESGRAGTLLESLGGREMLRSWSLSPELLEAETKARADESAAQHAYTDALDTGELAPIRAKKRELEATRAAHEAVVERIARESKSAIIVYPKAATLDELQGHLVAGDALVLYWLLPDEAVALVVTPDAARLVRLGRTPDVEAACAALAPSDPKSDPAKGRDALQAMVATKLGLAETTKRILVSSDGALSYVPFALLFPGKQVAYVPSGTAYGQLREDVAARGRGVLALGDPDYRRADASAVALVRGRQLLASLPGSGAEARAVGDVVLLGGQATVTSLKATVATRPRWKSIHLGCHGLVDPENPMRSSLALTPEAGGSGLLLAQDVGLLRMPTDLAVLSACETMKGRIYRGEGIVGIARMFMYAGAPRLLTSLWKVDDEATRALMTRFYEVWNPKDASKALGTAEALAAAQAYVRSQAKWSHPYYWAAWVLWGLPD